MTLILPPLCFLQQYRVPTAQGNRQNGQGHFAKMQKIWFTQVVNYLILRVKDISIFAAKISNLSWTMDKSAK